MSMGEFVRIWPIPEPDAGRVITAVENRGAPPQHKLRNKINQSIKKEPLLPPPYASIQSKSFESEGKGRSNRFVARSKGNSKVNGVDFDNGGECNGNGNGNGFDDEDDFDWEKEMRTRVKEIEDMKELERKAEELQTRAEEVEAEEDCEEETKEEKRTQVRKELEKVENSRRTEEMVNSVLLLLAKAMIVFWNLSLIAQNLST